MHKFSQSKPLYRYELSLDYTKHKKKLQQIRNKTITHHINSRYQTQTIEIGSRIKEYRKTSMSRSIELIEQQNQKLLGKLMKISGRTTVQKKIETKIKTNPYRKNWLENIKRENADLGDKLTNLRSSLEYRNFSKSMQSYERVKKSLMLNRKAKLPQLLRTNKQFSLAGSRKVHTLPVQETTITIDIDKKEGIDKNQYLKTFIENQETMKDQREEIAIQ